jgi:hypothetical protein
MRALFVYLLPFFLRSVFSVFHNVLAREPGSLVSAVSDYELDDRGSIRGRGFSL